MTSLSALIGAKYQRDDTKRCLSRYLTVGNVFVVRLHVTKIIMLPWNDPRHLLVS